MFFKIENLCKKTHCTVQFVMIVFWWTVPAPLGVCRWCFAAAPAAPGAAAWLSPAGAARLCSYWHSPSTEEAKHSSIFIYFPRLIVFFFTILVILLVILLFLY